MPYYLRKAQRVLLATFFLLSTQSAFSQKMQLPEVEGKITYSGVIQLDSTYKKNNLFINGKKFFVDVFTSGKDVLQMEDREEGIVIGRGYFPVPWKFAPIVTYDVNIWHSIKIYVKDGKYKFEITDFTYKYYGRTSGWNTTESWHEGTLESFDKKNTEKMQSYISIGIAKEIELLKTAMAKKQSSSEF